jgi:hypothetical protein
MFSSRFILLNNSALTNLPSSPHAVFLRGLRPQDAGTPLLVLLQKKKYPSMYSAIAVLVTSPWTRSYRKEPLFPHLS